MKHKQLLPLLGPAGLVGFDTDIPMIPTIPSYNASVNSDATAALKSLINSSTEAYEGEGTTTNASVAAKLTSPTNKANNKRPAPSISSEVSSTSDNVKAALQQMTTGVKPIANSSTIPVASANAATDAVSNTAPSLSVHNGSATSTTSSTSNPVSNLGLLPPSAYQLTAADLSTLNSSKDIDLPGNSSKYLRSIISSGSKLCPSIPAVRFERVSGKEWEFKENKIFNIESLVMNVNSVFYLLDENKLSAEERSTKKIWSTCNGFISLQSELQQRGALITSWPKFDHSHMLDFLESWISQDHQTSLIEFWNHGLFNSSSSRANSFAAGKEQEGSGIIAYEVVMQVGMVLRKNDKLGIREDCWRLIYPSDLLNDSQAASFGGFLMNFFPQLRSVLSKLTSDQISTTVVKYFPHKIDPPVLQPPRGDHGIAYQTIGTLDESTSSVLARFETSLSFHDIVIQLDC